MVCWAKNSPFPKRRQGGATTILLFRPIRILRTLLGLLTLVNTCCPDRHLHLKGVQRANRLGLSSIPLSADESRGTWFALLLGSMICAVHAILLSQAVSNDLFFSIKPGFSAFFLPSLLILASALYLQAARELWFSLGFWGFVGLLWITPILASLVLAVGWQDDYLDFIAMLSSFCPILAIPQALGSQYAFPVPEIQVLVLYFGNFAGIGAAIVLAFLLSVRLYLKPKQ